MQLPNIEDYQHTNINTRYIKSLSDYLDGINKYLEKKGIGFLFVLTPDKKTIYPEFFPDTINQLDMPSRTQLMRESFDTYDFEYIDLQDTLMPLKDEYLLFNPMYDVGHWNDIGAFYGNQAVQKKIYDMGYTDINIISEDDFDITTVHNETLPVSFFRIDEYAPLYNLRNKSIVQDNTAFSEAKVNVDSTTSYSHYINSEISYAPKALIIHDSYTSYKYYAGAFSETTFNHVKNIQNITEYVDFFKPGIVILEAVECVIGAGGFLNMVVVKNIPQ